MGAVERVRPLLARDVRDRARLVEYNRNDARLASSLMLRFFSSSATSGFNGVTPTEQNVAVFAAVASSTDATVD